MLAFGCASRNPGNIPKDAVKALSRTGQWAYIATAAGTAFIRDSETGQVVHTAALNYNDKLIFFPQRKQIILNGFVTEKPDLNEKHQYRLYFLKG